MPKNPTPIWPFSPEMIPLAKMEGEFGSGTRMANRAMFTPQRLRMEEAASKVLKKWPNVAREFMGEHGDEKTNSNAQFLVTVILFCDCFEIALNPELLMSKTLKKVPRFLELLSKHPDFTLAYLSALRRAASEQPTNAQKAIVAIRTMGGHAKKSETIAAEAKLGVDTIKKEKKKLSKWDLETYSDELLGKNKGLKRKNKSP